MTAGNPFKSRHAAPDIQYCHFGTEDQQAKFVISRMKELVGSDFVNKQGNPYALSYGDMAVLIRTNGDIRRFLPYLVEVGIPYVVDSGEIVFEQEIVTLDDGMSRLDFSAERPKGPERDGTNGAVFPIFEAAGLCRRVQGEGENRLTKLRSALDKIAAEARKDYLPNLGLQGIFHQLLEAMGLAEVDLSEPDHYYLATLSRAISDYEAVWQRLRHTEYKYFRGFIRAWGQFSYAVPPIRHSTYQSREGDDDPQGERFGVSSPVHAVSEQEREGPWAGRVCG